MYFSHTLHGQGNKQDAKGCFSYSGYAILCLCQSYPSQQWQFLWSVLWSENISFLVCIWTVFHIQMPQRVLPKHLSLSATLSVPCSKGKERGYFSVYFVFMGKGNLGWWYMGRITFISFLWCLFEMDGDLPQVFCDSSCAAIKFSEFRSSGQSTLNMWVCYLHTDHCKRFSKV